MEPAERVDASPRAARASASSLLDAVRQIEPVIRMHAADAERERRLSKAVTDVMRTSGLQRLWAPQVFGGLEVDPVTAFQVIEAVSRIDSAAGWNLQLSTGGDAFGPWFADDGAKDIFGKPDTIFAGSTFPPRRAVPVEGGYHVTGQTPFVSGGHQAEWFFGSAQIYDGEMPRLQDGVPVSLLTACPANEVMIVDTWRTPGMRGPGSHDVVMSDVFIPSNHAAVMAPYETPGSAYQGPLYKSTIWTIASVMASPALGIARAAIDDLLELAGRKTPSYLTTPLRDRSSVQALIGEAEATLGAGRAQLYEAAREAWDHACQGQVIDMPGKVKLQLAATYAWRRLRGSWTSSTRLPEQQGFATSTASSALS